MAKFKLADQEVQDAIRTFISEAKTCARTKRPDRDGILGCAALLTAFSCVIAVGESICTGADPHDKDFIGVFSEKFGDTRSWLVPLQPHEGAPTHDEVTDYLEQVRNGLVHALSMPPDVALLADEGSATVAKEKYPDAQWGISVPRFIEAVEDAIGEISKESGEVNWRGNRCFVSRLVVTVSEAGGGSASGAGAKPMVTETC